MDTSETHTTPDVQNDAASLKTNASINKSVVEANICGQNALENSDIRRNNTILDSPTSKVLQLGAPNVADNRFLSAVSKPVCHQSILVNNSEVSPSIINAGFSTNAVTGDAGKLMLPQFSNAEERPCLKSMRLKMKARQVRREQNSSVMHTVLNSDSKLHSEEMMQVPIFNSTMRATTEANTRFISSVSLPVSAIPCSSNYTCIQASNAISNASVHNIMVARLQETQTQVRPEDMTFKAQKTGDEVAVSALAKTGVNQLVQDMYTDLKVKETDWNNSIRREVDEANTGLHPCVSLSVSATPTSLIDSSLTVANIINNAVLHDGLSAQSLEVTDMDCSVVKEQKRKLPGQQTKEHATKKIKKELLFSGNNSNQQWQLNNGEEDFRKPCLSSLANDTFEDCQVATGTSQLPLNK